jgi:non-specific serine/threonine protein kinase
MLETIREYARERLITSGEEVATRKAHAAHFLALAERAELAIVLPQGDRWLSQLATEQENLRAALAWLEAAGEREVLLQLAGALSFFWFVRGHYREGSDWLERALAGGSAAPAGLRARALRGLGSLAPWHDGDRRTKLFSESVALCRASGNLAGVGLGLIGLAMAVMYQGDHNRAEQLLTEALSLARGLDDAAMATMVTCAALGELGYVAHAQGNRALAVTRFEEALGQDRALGYTWAAANELLGLGFVTLDEGDPARALDLFHESLTHAWNYGDWRVLVYALVGVASVAAASGQPERAARLFGAREALREMIGMPDSAVFPPYHATAERAVLAARAAVGPDVFATSWAAGRALRLEQVIAEASAITPASSSPAPSTGAAVPYGLTERELEVLRLLVEHHTDREIAEALFLSPRTVGWHVTHILNKLGVDARRQAAALARREGLV